MKTPVRKPIHPLFTVRAEVAEALCRQDSAVIIPFGHYNEQVRIFFKDGPVGSYGWYEGEGEFMYVFDTKELNEYLRRFDQ